MQTDHAVKKHWKLPLAMALIVIGVVGYFTYPVVFGPKVRVFRAQRAEIIQTVVASGRLETPARVDIGSQLTGRVAAVPVREGQSVKVGQLLIALEAKDEKAALEQAAATVRQAQVRLRQFEAQTRPIAEQAVKQAEVNLRNVQKQFARTRELVSQGFIGKAQLDDQQRNLDIARSQLSTAQVQLVSVTPSGSDYQLAVTALELARANEHAAQARFDHTRIVAVRDGVLIMRDVELGDTVQPGKILMVLSPLGLTQLVVQIDEKNLRFLRLGQTALAQADAYPGQKFNAQVAFINPGVNAQRGSVDVKLTVPAPPPYLKQDMTVSVEIEVARRQDALSLNAEAIHDPAGNFAWVMLVEGGKTVRRAVSLGMAGDKSMEIVAGLKESDLVLPATGVTVAAGKRVRVDVVRTDTSKVEPGRTGQVLR
jgi:HlyD family secretion protein